MRNWSIRIQNRIIRNRLWLIWFLFGLRLDPEDDVLSKEMLEVIRETGEVQFLRAFAGFFVKRTRNADSGPNSFLAHRVQVCITGMNNVNKIMQIDA